MIHYNKLSYSPQLDGLRAFCIIFTLLNHVGQVPFFIKGSIGVYIFFPLSGFLITNILMSGTDFKSYYIKRFFRIVPLYYIALSVTLILAYFGSVLNFGDDKTSQINEMLIPSILFSRELVFAHPAPTLFGQAWTIGIEEKFYLIFPFFILLTRRKILNLLYSCILLFSIFFLLGDLIKILNPNGYIAILFGVIQAIFLKKKIILPPLFSFLLVIISYLIIIFYESSILLISLSSSFLIVSLYTNNESILSKFLRLGYLPYLGKLTYSIYLFHVVIFYPIKVFATNYSVNNWIIIFLIGYSFCIFICLYIYKYIEKPLIDRGYLIVSNIK